MYVQETQLDKFPKKIASLSTICSVVPQAVVNTNSGRNENSSVSQHFICSIGRSTPDRRCGKQECNTGKRLTCKLCDKYSHLLVDC